MITFAQYLKNFSKKYVAVEFTKETEANLREFALKNGFDLTYNYNRTVIKPEDFKFHTTIFFTTSLHNTPEQIMSTSKFRVEPDHFELFGPDKNIPVLKLKVSEELFRVRELFINQGYKDAWAEYKPHISLSYNFKGRDIKNIPLPKFPIIVEKIRVESQK